MGNRTGKAIIFILVFSLIFPLVIARSTLTIDNTACYKDGSVWFNVNNKGDEILVKNIDIEATFLDTKFIVNGKWSSDIIGDDKSSIFKSSDNQFKILGVNKITLTYPSSEDRYINLEFNVNCPLFTYACSMMGINITSCLTSDGFFRLQYNANLNQGIKLDPENDLIYTIKENKNIWMDGSLPEDTIIESIGTNKYELRFPNHNEIKSIEIKTNGCDIIKYPESTAYVWKCSIIEEETENDTLTSKCDSNPSDYLRNQCYIQEAIDNNDTDMCDKLDDLSQRDNCYLKVATTHFDVETCDKIVNTPYYKVICYQTLGVEFDNAENETENDTDAINEWLSIEDEENENDSVTEELIGEDAEDVIVLASIEQTNETETKEVNPPSEKNIINKILSSLNLRNKPVYYYIGGVFILLNILFFVVKFAKRKKKDSETEQKLDVAQEVTEATSPIDKEISEAISIRNFTVKHGSNMILNNIEFNVKRKELVCLLGPSGTGKSTIIESLIGRRSPTSGEIRIFNTDISDKRIFNYVGFVPQQPELYMNQTVEQNLLSSTTKWGTKDAKSKIDKILLLVGLTERKEIHANKLSGGQLKLLSLGMELIRNPELLILDEPTTGLDPNTRESIITILSRIVTKQNKAVFFTSHHMEDAEECDNIIIIAKGQIVKEGTPSKLKKSLPGMGKIVSVELDNVTNELLKNINNLEGVQKVISEGRSLKIITEQPNTVKLGQKIDGIGGIVNKTEITTATMTEVFIYYTGKIKE